MPGGLLQLVATGAQTQLLHGNPTMTFFRTMYKRTTNFAMESIRLDFTNTKLQFPLSGGPTSFRCKVKRVTDLVHDCYLHFNLPDIWSPIFSSTTIPQPGDPGYEFQWIENIGYNAIDRAIVSVNGVKIYETTGEWFKLYSYMTHDRNKRDIVDQMVGNISEIKDPGNAFGRFFQYPHAIQVPDLTVPVEPSIRGRQIIVPLHFWFCEDPGMALPLIALQNGEVEIEIRMRPVYELFTILDIAPNATNNYTPTGERIRANAVDYPMNLFLTPPNNSGRPTNAALTNWFPDPYIEANYIYLTEGERAQVANADQSFLFKEVRWVTKEGQYGPADVEIPFHNLVTRMVWTVQRQDRLAQNDFDNYTNWYDRNRRPIQDVSPPAYNTPMLQLSSGAQQAPSIARKDILVESTLLLDAKERVQAKPATYSSLIQHYRHNTGSMTQMPGAYMYSFALDHNTSQPSGALNGSQFNKVTLRLTLIQPIPRAIQPTGPQPVQVCVYKNTVFNNNPTPVPNALLNQVDPARRISPADVIQVIQRGTENIIYSTTYQVNVYVESYNVLRIVSGLANLVFAS